MKKLIALAIAFMALLGSPLRAEIVKKVIAPSPTLTKLSLIEKVFGDTHKVVCHSTVHPNIKTLTYVSFGVVLDVDHKRNRVKVIDLYPANTVEELEAKIAERDSKGRKESVVAGGHTPRDNITQTEPPDPNPNPTTAPGSTRSTRSTPVTAHTKEGLTFVGPDGTSRPLTVENVHAALEAIRGQVKELNDRVVSQDKAIASVTVVKDAALQSLAALQKALLEESEKLKSYKQAAEVDLPAERLITASLTSQLATMEIEMKKVEQRIKMEVDAKGAKVQDLYLSYLWWIVPGVLLLVFTAFLIGRYSRPRMFELPRHLHRYESNGANIVTLARLKEILRAQQADLRLPTRPAKVPEPRVVLADPSEDLPPPEVANAGGLVQSPFQATSPPPQCPEPVPPLGEGGLEEIKTIVLAIPSKSPLPVRPNPIPSAIPPEER